MSFSLDETKIHFQLRDSELITKSCYFENNVLFSHLADCKIKVDLTLNDFLPIFHHISKSKKPSRGEVEEFDKFYDYCQYIGEVELPILVTKDSDLIQRWYMTTKDLIISEKERLILKMYVDMDNDDIYSIQKYLDEYTSDKYNNKLNEKTQGKLFKSLNELLDNPNIIQPINFKIIEEKETEYQCVKAMDNNSYNHINIAIDDLNIMFNEYEFPWKHNSSNAHLFIAGGCVLKSLMKNKKAFIKSDYDIFIITRDEEIAKEMISNVYVWIISTCNEYFIISTNNSISFVTNRGTFQIILRLYHSKEQVLCGFDIDACCVGFDGNNILSIPRGLLSLKRKTILAIGWRQSETMAYRCYKYSLRGFNIAIPGLSKEEFDNVDISSKSILAKIINRQSIKNSDYGETLTDEYVIFNDHILSYIEGKVLRSMERGFSPNINVLTKSIAAVFDTRQCFGNDYIKTQNGNIIHSKISFVSKMSHGQITGSFKPTKEDWFSGVKW